MGDIERIPIASIHIGERRRQELGDIASLAKNIELHGLIHPIVISSDNELVAGERRLRAHQHLGWDTIDVRRWAVLDPDQQREIELAENLDRKDLTPIERSRNVVALADVAAEVDTREFRGDSPRNGPGRPEQPGSLRRVAARLGIDKKDIQDARKHVAAVETYPALSSLPQSVAITAARGLNALPEEERPTALTEIAAAPNVQEVAYRLADEAQRQHMDALRYQQSLLHALRPLSRLGAAYDPEDVAAAIDEDFFHRNIEIPLEAMQAWVGRVRAAMPSGLRVVQGGRR